MSYAFSFDAGACTGCKACQAACKDKNNLPVGVLWRRVIEVSGGSWVQNGAAWENNVFSYNLSMACNHCVHPKCAGVCPTNAYHVRADGIVILDSSKCIGCGYCNWACPYAVPQYNQALGVMSKCNFCFDAIEAGLEPACVSACPMRVLDFEQISTQAINPPGLALWELAGAEHPFPLPAFSRTQPHIRLRLHPAMANSLEKAVSNREEIKPAHAKSELPLVFFTLLAQMAVGTFWASQMIFAFAQTGSETVRQGFILLEGLFLAVGMLISFAHLGKKQNAWRVLSNLKKSSLSQEILFLSLFGVGWLLSGLFPILPLRLLTACLGLALVNSMANVYGIRSMAVWNTWRTLAGFLLSASLLGVCLSIAVLQFQAVSMLSALSATILAWLTYLSILLLFGELMISTWGKFSGSLTWIRRCLILTAMLLLMGGVIPSVRIGLNFSILFFLLVLAEELLGRWLFYAELDQRIL